MPGRPPHLPDAFVRLRPHGFEMLHEGVDHAPVVRVRREPGPRARVGRVEHLAPDVQLKLSMSGVADAHRRGSLVAGEPRQLELGQPPLASEAVHDLELGGGAREGAKQPLSPGTRLVEIAAQDQGVESKRRVPHPAQPVVPVAYAAQPLGQGGGRRGDDSAGGLVDHGLDRDEGAQHRVAIGALVGAAPGPSSPPRLGLRDGGVGVDRLRRGKVRRVPGQRERAMLTGGDGEVGDGGELFAAERHVGGEQEGVGAGHRADSTGGAAHPGHHRAIVHTNHQLHAHGDRAPEADDLADDHRRPVALRHTVHDGDGTGVRLEAGLQHERVVPVATVHRACPVAWRERPAPVLGPAQQGGEAGRGVEAGDAEPVDGSPARDQGGGLAVPDERVVFDGVGHGCVGALP